MATYEILKRTIANQKNKGTLDPLDMLTKLDTFLLFNRIDDGQYRELVTLVSETEPAE